MLASILIASLSVAMLLGGVAVSANLGRQADGADAYFYKTLTAAETQSSPDPTASLSTIVIKKGEAEIADIPIQVYGNEGLWSYAFDTAGGDGS